MAFSVSTQDGYYVSGIRAYGGFLLHLGHMDTVGGLFSEWSDGDRWPGDTAGDEGYRLCYNQARRMIRRARRENGE